jgi:restriction endonuclease Mrr
MKKLKEITSKTILEQIDSFIEKYKLDEKAKEELIKMSKNSYCLGSADLFKIMEKRY